MSIYSTSLEAACALYSCYIWLLVEGNILPLKLMSWKKLENMSNSDHEDEPIKLQPPKDIKPTLHCQRDPQIWIPHTSLTVTLNDMSD